MPRPVKKVVILDAGGVLQPDAEFGAPHQVALAELTKLSERELNQYQDYHFLNKGEQSLSVPLARLAEDLRGINVGIDELLQAYKKGITLYPGAPELIRDLYKAGYQVVLCTNNSDLGVVHTRELLAKEGLSCVKVYGSAELHVSKPDPKIFLHICEVEKVSPEECWFVDDRESNRCVAKSLGMSVVSFDRPAKLVDAAKEINTCRDQFVTLGILSSHDFIWPKNFNRGKYPSLLGIDRANRVVNYQPAGQSFIATDMPNEDGNLRKRCIYESRLAQLIIEQGRQYWASGYHAINRLFLSDFDLKSDPKRAPTYNAYIEKIGTTLKKEGLMEVKQNNDIQDLRAALVRLFSENFNLTNVSQFYYNVWLFNYGPEPLEPFVFLTDLLRETNPISNSFSSQVEQIGLLKLFPDMAHNIEDRYQAYAIAQPWLTCGIPQLRGRQPRLNAPKPADAKTFGIVRDDDPDAAAFYAPPHFAAKNFFSPAREHPMAKAFQAEGAPVIGGSSGTLGRNIFMLAPLVQGGLLTQIDLMCYVMGFWGDLVYRGHHSYEEIAVVAEQVLFPLKPWLDSLRDPMMFYEQLLTDEFIASDMYHAFSAAHESFFDAPVVQKKL